MKNVQKKATLKPKQENYYQSQYYKKMINKKDYSNWIKEKIFQQQSNLNPRLLNNNISEKSKDQIKNNLNDKKIKKNYMIFQNREEITSNLSSNRRKINDPTSLNSKRVKKENNSLYKKYTNIGTGKNSAFETFAWMKNKNKNKKNKILSKSMTSFNFNETNDINPNSSQEKKNLKRNLSMKEGVEFNQDYENKNNFKNRAVNNNYRFIINNNYYNKNNKNLNHLASESLQFFIGKEEEKKKGGFRSISEPKSLDINDPNNMSKKDSNDLEILRLEKKIQTLQGKINKLSDAKKLMAENTEIDNIDFNPDDLNSVKADIFDIINGIENSDDSQKKGLTAQDIKIMAENIGLKLYHTGEKDFPENGDFLKNAVNILNNMKQSDKNKAISILREKADDENKKKQFNALQEEITKDDGLRNFIKNIIDKKTKEEKKLDNVVEDLLEELDSDCTVIMSEEEEEKKNDKEEKKTDKVDKVVNMLKVMEKNDQNIIFDKLKNKTMKFGQIYKIKKVYATIKAINKMKSFAKDIKNKLKKINSPRSEKEKREEEDDIENLENAKLKKIFEGFQKDLFDDEDIPLTRKEMKENEIDNNEKIKKLSKILDSMNKKDREIIMNKLKIKVDDEYKQSQYDKLVKLYNNIKNVKSFFVKYVTSGNNNKKGETKNDLSKNELDNIINDILKDLFNNTSNNNETLEKNIKNSAKTINRLNQTQQKLVLKNLKGKADTNQKIEILQKLETELKGDNKLNLFSKAFNLKNSTIINIKNKNIKKEEKESNIELNENEIINLVEAIIGNLFNKTNKDKNDVDIYVSEIDKYLLKTEKEKNLENTTEVLKTLKRKDSQKISQILNYILKSDDQIKELNELNKKVGISNENDKIMKNVINIIDDFNNDDEAEELKDDKLLELTHKLSTGLMKDYSEEEKNKKIDSLNRAANSIILLNKKDQEKIIDTLNDLAQNEKQKETMEKLNKLVDNLNYMKFYLYSLDEKIIDKNFKKDLKKKDFNNLKTNVMTHIFEEDEFDLNLTNNSDENINNITKLINNLSNNNKTKILEEIREKAKEYENNENVKKTIEKLNQNLKKEKMAHLFSNLLEFKLNNEKKQLSDNEIQHLVDKINGALFDDQNNQKSNNYTEQLLLNKNKERKIQKLVNSINCFNEETQKKTLLCLTKSNIGNKNKAEFNKLKSSIMSNISNNNTNNNNNKPNNKQNLLGSALFWQNSLGRLELNDVELNILIDTFFKDLFNEEILDDDIKEDNLNLIANLIKELHIENQNKVMEIIEKKPEAKNKSDLIENLRERILRLRLLKDELEEKDENPLDKTQSHEGEENYDNLDDLGDIIEEVDESEETLTVEISVEDMDKKDLDEICNVFKAEVVNDNNDEKITKDEKEVKKKKKNLNKSVNFLASSIVRLDKAGQKQITDKLEKNAKNEDEKEQLNLLMERVKELNAFKKISKEIKQRKKEQMELVEKEIKQIEDLNENCNKNLNKKNLEKLEKEIIDNLYNQRNIKFSKNKEIKKYLLKAQNQENIKFIAKKINALSDEDKQSILNQLQTLANDKEKKSQYNKLIKLIEDRAKIKELNDKIKEKKNNSKELSKDKLEVFAKNCLKSIFDKKPSSENNQKDILTEVANKIVNLNENNQDYILNNLKEKSNNNEENTEQMNKVMNMVNKKSNLKKFKDKFEEKMINKKEIEKIENEKKYGIYIISNDEKDKNSKMILIKKPTELLNEDKLNEIQNVFMEDLEKISEEGKNKDISDIDKYLKEKDNEKKCEEIIDVINTLVFIDKNKIIKNIKNNFDKPEDNNLFIKFMKLLKKKEKIFDNEKRKRQEHVLEEIEGNEKK